MWTIRPDAGFFTSLPQVFSLFAGGDDSVLSRVVRFFEAKGLTVRGAHEVAPDLLADAGQIGAIALSRQGHADAMLGFAVRTALGPLDAGQAVAVADGRVLAIEGAEGTDAMLERIAGLARAETDDVRRGVLTKGPKPGQELRVDMPAIGPRTIELAVAARLAGVAVEAGGVLMLDRDETIRGADAHGCAIEGLARADVGQSHSAESAYGAGRVMGRVRPSARDRTDIAKGLAAVERLARFETGSAVVVARAYILAFAAAESCVCDACAGALAPAVGHAREAQARRPGVPRGRARGCLNACGVVRPGCPAGIVRNSCHRNSGGAGTLRGIAAARGRPWPVPGNMPAEQYEVARWRTFRQQDLGARACGNEEFPRTATISACS